MELKQAKELVRSRLSDKRYEHTINVKKMAVKLAKHYGTDPEQAALAALLHDAAKELPDLVRHGSRPDVVVLDPPRAGCEKRVLDAIAQVRPKRVVYVSCNPASLARDAAILRDHGFVLRKVQPVDVFPHTCHVESVALFSRSENS